MLAAIAIKIDDMTKIALSDYNIELIQQIKFIYRTKVQLRIEFKSLTYTRSAICCK